MSSLPKGYTLIELLVVISIIGLLVGVGIVGYLNFAANQELENAYREFATNLALARQLALSGEKPQGCNGTLTAYEVSFSSSTSYQIKAVCGETKIPVRTFNLPSGVNITGYQYAWFQFFPLGRGTNIQGSLGLLFVQATTGKRLVATIDKAGNISPPIITNNY
jgi:prepilin-type N-terminal cleavage/methylation domain-containing protein